MNKSNSKFQRKAEKTPVEEEAEAIASRAQVVTEAWHLPTRKPGSVYPAKAVNHHMAEDVSKSIAQLKMTSGSAGRLYAYMNTGLSQIYTDVFEYGSDSQICTDNFSYTQRICFSLKTMDVIFHKLSRIVREMTGINDINLPFRFNDNTPARTALMKHT
jgi:hypothetical protein